VEAACHQLRTPKLNIHVTHHGRCIMGFFWCILHKIPPYSLHGFLGSAQDSSVEPGMLGYLDESCSREQPINSLQGDLQHCPQQGLSPSPEMARGGEACGGGRGGGRHAFKAFPSQACWRRASPHQPAQHVRLRRSLHRQVCAARPPTTPSRKRPEGRSILSLMEKDDNYI